jgi:hypothetical protein
MNKSKLVLIDSDLKLNNILRRYLDLPRYVELLRTQSLYFRRADLFPDKFEGALTPAIRSLINDALSTGKGDYDADSYYQFVRNSIYLNCWSFGSHDNMALWKLYGGITNGIVITTTLKRLVEAGLSWENEVKICRVKYIDHFKNPDMVLGSVVDPFRFKHLIATKLRYLVYPYSFWL